MTDGLGTRYLAILKGKEGECRAIASLDAEVRAECLPLIEVPPRKATSVVTSLFRRWPEDGRILLDLTDGGAHRHDTDVAEYTYGHIALATVAGLAPVVQVDAPRAYREVIGRAARQFGRVCCFRVTRRVGGLTHLDQRLRDLAAELQLPLSAVDLVLDLGDVTETSVGIRYETARHLLLTLPELRDWRTVSVVSGAFPSSLTRVGCRSIGRIPRHDLELGLRLAELRDRLPVRPMFGDYGAYGTAFPTSPHGGPAPRAIRYTTESHWVVARGAAQLKDGGENEFRSLARQVTGHWEFADRAYSPGDDYIYSVAWEGEQPGGFTRWIEAATARHLTVTVRDLRGM